MIYFLFISCFFFHIIDSAFDEFGCNKIRFPSSPSKIRHLSSLLQKFTVSTLACQKHSYIKSIFLDVQLNLKALISNLTVSADMIGIVMPLNLSQSQPFDSISSPLPPWEPLQSTPLTDHDEGPGIFIIVGYVSVSFNEPS